MTDSFASRRSTQWLVIAVCAAVAVVCSAELIALGYPREYAAVRIAAYSVSYLIAGSVAWIRRPDNPIGPVMLATSVAGSLSFFGGFGDPIVGRVAGAFGSLTNLFGIWLILAAPTGRLVPGAGRWLLAVFAVILALGNIVQDLAILRVVFAFGAVTSLLIAGVVFQRWKTASGASRRALTPVMRSASRSASSTRSTSAPASCSSRSRAAARCSGPASSRGRSCPSAISSVCCACGWRGRRSPTWSSILARRPHRSASRRPWPRRWVTRASRSCTGHPPRTPTCEQTGRDRPDDRSCRARRDIPRARRRAARGESFTTPPWRRIRDSSPPWRPPSGWRSTTSG